MFARIDVADTGRGIREEDLPKVFGRFWRAAESAESPGVGIGLYLAREIITSCGGYIKVSSTPGQGSVFSVFLSKV
jgi:signal transduction histidine kinase